ncbi:hypothetical protein [Alkalihalophilus marmarensis]|uniref:Uncharacterized protein n=1 Tax=Alkalihalophilus marmarensis DSM 21297 TaxID=1188261 RepID=U6SL08_9BACI|nr:hypothetical protein [Alkalihalophilus marmarensis]ERN52072.1 hypothetical protein A33I_18440 [Alkalihalophilus marmarensis DSM 21297]
MRDMKVIGEGCNAIRIYSNEDGCEIRASGILVQGNKDMNEMIKIMTTKDVENGLLQLAEVTGETPAYLRKAASNLLNDLRAAGVPLFLWCGEWVGE